MSRKATAVILLVATLALLLSACAAAEKLTEYEFGTDKVPSVNAVIGESRKVTSVNVGTSNGVPYREYTYTTNTMVDDLGQYTTFLRSRGWLATIDFNFYDGRGDAQLAINSADAGKILVMFIAFEPNRYTIRVEKLVGELTAY
jgi:hypothetical protein